MVRNYLKRLREYLILNAIGFSKSESLARYWELHNSVVEFLGGDSDLAKDVIACHQDTSYLAN